MELNKSIFRFANRQRKSIRHLSHLLLLMPNEENLHKMRVALVKLDTILRLCEECNSDLRFQNLREKLQKLRKLMGKERSLHIALNQAPKYQFDARTLKAEQKLALKKIKRRFQSGKIEKLISSTEKAVRNLRHTKSLNLEKGIKKQKIRLEEWNSTPSISMKNYHELRKLLKSTVYILEAMKLSGESLQPLAHALGELHDLEELESFFASTPPLNIAIQRQQEKANLLLKRSLKRGAQQISLLSKT